MLGGRFLGGFFGRHLGWERVFFHHSFGFGSPQLDANWCVAPNFFQVVILANRGLHDVHHHSTAVNDDPFAVFFTFDAGFAKSGFAHFIAHTGCQGFGLAVRGAASNDDPLEQCRQMLGIEHLDVLRLDVLQTVNDDALQFLNVFFFRGFGHVGPCRDDVVEYIESPRG